MNISILVLFWLRLYQQFSKEIIESSYTTKFRNILKILLEEHQQNNFATLIRFWMYVKERQVRGGEARGLNESVKKGKLVTNFFSDKC